MKTNAILAQPGRTLILVALLAATVQVGGWAQTNYVPTANEEIYGTWINDKSINADHIQKKVSSPEGNKDYLQVSDPVPFFEDTQQIYRKWTDSEGNIWYKIFGTVVKGLYQGTKWQELDKLSKSATVWEYVYTVVGDFNSDLYPAQIYPTDPHYRIFYRAEAPSSSASGPEESWLLAGSWTNPEYETSRIFAAKVVYGDDGMMSIYQRLSNTSRIRLPYTIEKSWSEPGIHWFKIKYSDGHLTFYEIIRLSKDGNALDAVGAYTDYPASFDMTSKSYYHYSRHRE